MNTTQFIIATSTITHPEDDHDNQQNDSGIWSYNIIDKYWKNILKYDKIIGDLNEDLVIAFDKNNNCLYIYCDSYDKSIFFRINLLSLFSRKREPLSKIISFLRELG